MSKTVATLAEAVDIAKSGGTAMTKCPAHNDGTASLSVSHGTEQPVVFHCHAGCEAPDIVKMGELEWADVMGQTQNGDGPDEMWTPAGKASNVYRYTDANGRLVFTVYRVPRKGGKGKQFLQCRPDPTAPHGRVWNLEGIEPVLYRLPNVIRAVRAGRTIHIAEGEKCVEALLKVIPEGDEATCNPMGAMKWRTEYSAVLAGANVILYADSDETGTKHMREVRESLIEVNATVKILEAPDGELPSGKRINDVADHLEAGHPLHAMLETSPEQQQERAKTGIDILDLIGRPFREPEWVIDRTLAKKERLLLTGFEGQGKSTLCRQIAACVAAGLHPFTMMPLKEPKRVLFIDAENQPEQVQESWAALVGLMGRHGHEIERGQLIVMEEFESNRDLPSIDGASWLEERMHAYKPDLVVMGPLTNLANRDLRDDEPVRKMRNAVDRARQVSGAAFIMEHHAPHKGPTDKDRPVRPYGSSLFLKWPDYGFGLKPTETDGVFEWHKNRGPRVRTRSWPLAVREGKPNSLELPWMECEPPPEEKRGRR